MLRAKMNWVLYVYDFFWIFLKSLEKIYLWFAQWPERKIRDRTLKLSNNSLVSAVMCYTWSSSELVMDNFMALSGWIAVSTENVDAAAATDEDAGFETGCSVLDAYWRDDEVGTATLWRNWGRGGATCRCISSCFCCNSPRSCCCCCCWSFICTALCICRRRRCWTVTKHTVGLQLQLIAHLLLFFNKIFSQLPTTNCASHYISWQV